MKTFRQLIKLSSHIKVLHQSLKKVQIVVFEMKSLLLIPKDFPL